MTRCHQARAGPTCYRITVCGRIADNWLVYFEGLAARVEEHEGQLVTVLEGMLPDQAAVYGTLEKLYSLDMTLLSIAQSGDAVSATDSSLGGS